MLTTYPTNPKLQQNHSLSQQITALLLKPSLSMSHQVSIMSLPLDLYTAPVVSASSIKGKGAISRSRKSKREQNQPSLTLVRLMKDNTDVKEERSDPAVTITCLPAEIRLEILCLSMTFSDLRNTILAHPAFYECFHPYKKTACINVIWNIFRRSVPGSDLWKRMWTDTIRNAVTEGDLSFERAIARCSFPCISMDDYSALVNCVTQRKKKIGFTSSLNDMVAISICGYTSQRYHWDQESYLRLATSLDQIKESHSLLQRLNANIRAFDSSTKAKIFEHYKIRKLVNDNKS